jgi:hypothetical protein
MSGTILSATPAIRLMPPTMTMPVRIVMTRPYSHGAPADERHRLLDRIHRLVHLERVAPAKRAADAEQREGDRQHATQPRHPALGETLRQVLHGAAEHPLLAAPDVAVHLPERALGELGGHPEEAGDDHPERRPRAAERDGNGHARDVAEPHRG